MKDFFLSYYEIFSILDLFFLVFLLINSIMGLNNGFILSLLNFLKWVLALIFVKFFLPVITPYTDELISSQFTHDMVFGSIIFLLSIFFIIIVSKGLNKTVNWSGFGNVDKFFGFFFGIIKGYFYFVSIFTIINFIHPSEKWNNSLNNGKFFEIIFYGKNLIITNLPKRYEYLDNGSEKVNKLIK